MNKYRNVPTEIDGIKFASKKEARRYSELKLLEKGGQAGAIECHPRFPLVVNDYLIGYYTADFRYLDAHFNEVVEDVKSSATKTQAYRLRKKLMKAIHGIDVREV